MPKSRNRTCLFIRFLQWLEIVTQKVAPSGFFISPFLCTSSHVTLHVTAWAWVGSWMAFCSQRLVCQARHTRQKQDFYIGAGDGGLYPRSLSAHGLVCHSKCNEIIRFHSSSVDQSRCGRRVIIPFQSQYNYYHRGKDAVVIIEGDDRTNEAKKEQKEIIVEK